MALTIFFVLFFDKFLWKNFFWFSQYIYERFLILLVIKKQISKSVFQLYCLKGTKTCYILINGHHMNSSHNFSIHTRQQDFFWYVSEGSLVKRRSGYCEHNYQQFRSTTNASEIIIFVFCLNDIYITIIWKKSIKICLQNVPFCN